MSWLKNHTTTVRAAVIIAMGGLALQRLRHEPIRGRTDRRGEQPHRSDRSARGERRIARRSGQPPLPRPLPRKPAPRTTAAQGAATEARSANQRLDQTNGRIDAMEKAPARTPRG